MWDETLYAGSALYYAAGRMPYPPETADILRLVAAVYSLSSSTPHLFGDQLSDFDRELRSVLRAASPDGIFAELRREIALDIWRP